jgi:hypothetical protein
MATALLTQNQARRTQKGAGHGLRQTGDRVDAADQFPYSPRMAKKSASVGRKSLEPKSNQDSTEASPVGKPAKPSSLLDTRVVYCGDNLEQLAKLPDACVDLIYIDPPFNSNRNYGGGQSGTDFWGETKEKRAFEDRHEKLCKSEREMSSVWR